MPETSKNAPFPEKPTFIGPYKVECQLRKGGMSVLYLALQPKTKELTTIKVLLPKYLSNPEVVERFLKEAEIIALADHPNIIRLFGYGEWENGLFIAMEFIEGISLRQHILQTHLSLKRALEILLDIAYALCHLHTHGVIHRDLKPENILITEEGDVKVIDFGIAQLLNESVSEGESHRFIGTPVYMSPEQQKNPSSVSFASDIYSLGIIAYELILGKLSKGHVHLSLLPKGLQPLLQKALQTDPKDRYQNIVDFITDISSYLHSDELQKEKKPRDKVGDLALDLKKAQDIFSKEPTHKLPFISISSGRLRGNLPAKTLLFTSKKKGSSFVFFGEAKGSHAESLLFFANLKGMLTTLSDKAPVSLLKSLASALKKEPLSLPFSGAFLFFSPEGVKTALFGDACVWYQSKTDLYPLNCDYPLFNSSLSLKTDLKLLPWQPENALFFHSSSSLFSKEKIKEAIQSEETNPTSKDHAASALRRLRPTSFTDEFEDAFSFYTIHYDTP